MVLRKQSIGALVVEMESDHPTDWTRNNHFKVTINNKKKNRRIPVLSNANWLTIQFLLLLIRKTRREQRNRLQQKRNRLIK
jgi:hypothetical protein